MRTGTVSYKLEDLKKGVIIPIGFVGENDFTRVIFDAEEIYKKYPNASVSMKVQPPKGVIYPAAVTRDGNTVIWQVKEADVANRGGGELQLTFTDGETKIKTYIAKTDVKRSLAGNGPAPDPIQDFVDNANEKLAEVDDALEDLAAMDNIAKTAQASDIGKALSPKTVENGVVTEWEYITPGGGTEDYTDLDNKPSIAGVTLAGDKSLHDLGIAAESAIPDVSGKANLSVVAPAFDQATANDAGSLVTYTDGVVYVLPEGHTAGTTWANTQKTATNIAEQQRLLLTAIQGLDDDFDNAVFFEETQDDDSIEGIIKSEIKSKMRFSLSGNTLSINYDGETVTTVTLPSTQPIPCTDIELNIAVKSIEAGETFNLTATVTPSNTTDSVTWESSNDSVASVLNGVVTGIASGTATITVSCGSYSDTCAVTVTAFYTNLVLGNVLSDNDKLRYRSGYSYKQGCTFNDPFLYKLSSGQKIKVVKVQGVTNLYVSLYAYGTGTFTNKVEADGDNYVLTNDMIGMEDGSSYNILTSSSKLYGYSEYLDNWAGDYTATQDCYVALHFLIVNSDLTDRLNEIKSAVRIEVE